MISFAPRYNESDPSYPKSAEGSFSMFKVRTSLQRERSDTVTAIFNTTKVCTLQMLKIRTAPHPGRSDPPKVRRGFTFDVQTVGRATAAAISRTQSLQRERAFSLVDTSLPLKSVAMLDHGLAIAMDNVFYKTMLHSH